MKVSIQSTQRFDMVQNSDVEGHVIVQTENGDRFYISEYKGGIQVVLGGYGSERNRMNLVFTDDNAIWIRTESRRG